VIDASWSDSLVSSQESSGNLIRTRLCVPAPVLLTRWMCLNRSRMFLSCGSTRPSRGRLIGSGSQHSDISSQHSSSKYCSRSGRTPVAYQSILKLVQTVYEKKAFYQTNCAIRLIQKPWIDWTKYKVLVIWWNILSSV
jgi:hypothetical protein